MPEKEQAIIEAWESLSHYPPHVFKNAGFSLELAREVLTVYKRALQTASSYDVEALGTYVLSCLQNLLVSLTRFLPTAEINDFANKVSAIIEDPRYVCFRGVLAPTTYLLETLSLENSVARHYDKLFSEHCEAFGSVAEYLGDIASQQALFAEPEKRYAELSIVYPVYVVLHSFQYCDTRNDSAQRIMGYGITILSKAILFLDRCLAANPNNSERPNILRWKEGLAQILKLIRDSNQDGLDEKPFDFTQISSMQEVHQPLVKGMQIAHELGFRRIRLATEM